ncbi:MAG: rhodanese-like domain-containing protein [Sediminibacterium sp.]
MEINQKAAEICPTTTYRRVQEGALIVDVRENEEVNELACDVPAILHIPLSEFEERFNEVPRNREVILVCRSGIRSLKATYYLMNHGYTNVMNMQHGMLRWADKGFPVKGSINVQSPSGDCCGTSSTQSSSCCGTSTGSNCC